MALPTQDSQPHRRDFLALSAASAAFVAASQPASAELSKTQPMPALSDQQQQSYGKSRISYPDFTQTESGLQYKDAKPGSGDPSRVGDRVVIDWEGYTIGFYGRPFEARNKVKGGAFTGDDKDFFRFIIGKGTAIPALEEGLLGMRIGGVRQIIVPPELGYPASDPSHTQVGPKPLTFSGQRALDFVLQVSGAIDIEIYIG